MHGPTYRAAFLVTIVVMGFWIFTDLGDLAARLFARVGLAQWSWPISGVAIFWLTYFALRSLQFYLARNQKLGR